MGLSTRALKSDSLDLDPRSGFNVVLHELDTARRLHTTGLDLTHCPRALSRSTAGRLDPDRDHVEAKWSLDPDS